MAPPSEAAHSRPFLLGSVRIVASLRALKSEDPGEAAGAPAPKPPQPEEIARLMEEAERSRPARPRRKPEAPTARLWPAATLVAVWSGLVGCALAGVLIGLSSGAAPASALVLAVGVAAVVAMLLAGAAMRLGAPLLLTGIIMRRAAGKQRGEAAQLAGAEVLSVLGIAEKALDADEDARLVTRRDGVVAYANRAYIALAREAGVIGAAGLPPRIDRLFAQQGAEATKLFRLCRAARAGVVAEEVVRQRLGERPRRFEVAVRPFGEEDEHVLWRLRALADEEEQTDSLAAAYADYLRPVFALERSGQIAWANAAMRAALGATRGALAHIDEIVLGESGELVRALWRVDQAALKARVRRVGDDPADAAFRAFRRGGVGEGFVCVELDVEEEPETAEPAAASGGDMADAPFGAAVVEGDLGRDARIVEANKVFVETFGGAKKNAPLARAFPQEALYELAAEVRRKQASGGAPRPVEARLGEGPAARVYALYARPVRRRRGGYGSRRTLLYSVDVTDRRRMEEEHAQDQKLKAIGRLAGEVAHDFNNLLQVVLGNCERLMLKHPAGDPAYKDLVLIRENAQRAANMTKQLLAFSRKQTLKREVLSITELLRDFVRFLDRAVGEKVQLDLDNGRGLPAIRVDRNQLETAIMNLAVNARDAMGPSGGRLTIRTRLAGVAEIEAAAVPNLGAGDHLLIEVADTGPGVPKEIADKIFDPFFTTKEEGKGTGLGLSTVYGIIGQMDGAITVGEAEGGGAAFRIYLPAWEGAAAAEEIAPAEARRGDLTGAGRILVVEDEDAVRNFVVAALEDRGYEVTSTADGEEALEVLAEDEEGFDLVISDVMMPEMDGPTLVAKARESGLEAKIIFMSAYAETAVREQLDTIPGAGYIQKPFTLKGLAAKVKETLEGQAA